MSITLSAQHVCCNVIRVPPDEPPLWLVRAMSAGYQGDATEMEGWAADTDLPLAKRRATAEWVERVTYSEFSHQLASIATQNPSSGTRFDCTLIAGVPDRLPTTHQQVWWSQARRLLSDENEWLPLELLSLVGRGPELIREPITTGCASGDTVEQAALNATLEVLERHAFMQWYVYGQAIQEVVPKSPWLTSCLATMGQFRLLVRLFEMPRGLIDAATIMAVIFDSTGYGPAVTAGLATGFDLRFVISKAICEAWQPRVWLRSTETDAHAMKERSEIHTVLQRGSYWRSHHRIHQAEEMLGHPQPVDERDVRSGAGFTHIQAANELERSGHPVFVVQVPQPADAESVVLRVVTPTLSPLYLDEAFSYGQQSGTPQSVGPHFFL